jgi:pentatricopeptide repeat protein
MADLQAYILGFLRRWYEGHSGASEELLIHTANELCFRSGGLFQYLSFVRDLVLADEFDGSLKDLLQRCPAGLGAAYQMYLGRVFRAAEADPSMAAGASTCSLLLCILVAIGGTIEVAALEDLFMVLSEEGAGVFAFRRIMLAFGAVLEHQPTDNGHTTVRLHSMILQWLRGEVRDGGGETIEIEEGIEENLGDLLCDLKRVVTNGHEHLSNGVLCALQQHQNGEMARIVLRRYAYSRQHAAAATLLDAIEADMSTCAKAPSLLAWAAYEPVIQCLSTAGERERDRALGFWKSAVAQGFGLGQAAYRISTKLINASDSVIWRKQVVEEMAAAGVRPNEVTYNSLVNGYVQSRNMDAARAVVEEMAAAGVRPNERTYNSLVNGYAKEYPPALDEAERIHALMLVQKLIPNKYTYGALIRCGGAARRPDRSLYWFETAVTAGVRLDPANFAMLVKAAGYRDALAACAKQKLDLDQMLADN